MDNQAPSNDKENVNPDNNTMDIEMPKVYTLESKLRIKIIHAPNFTFLIL